MGTGLDNLNPNFPDGDGVQVFLTFDLNRIPQGRAQSAVLSSENPSVSGAPFEDLGVLTAKEVQYSEFSSALWDLAPVGNGADCILAETASPDSMRPFRGRSAFSG